MASITVSATGTAPVEEHRAEVHLGIETAPASPPDALAALASRVERLRGVLAERGVPDADVTTEQLHVQPHFDPQVGRPVGTTAGTSVRVALPSLDAVPALLTAVVDDDVRVHHVGQVPVVTEAVESAARRDAVGKARARAAELAEAVGGTLGGLLSLLEGGPPPAVSPTGMRLAAAAAPEVHLWERGSVASVTVTAVYELVER